VRKRPVSVAALETIADRVEATLQDRPEGNRHGRYRSFVMEELRKLDKVAYVRFASVYNISVTSASSGTSSRVC
jgi:transcriptional regulator NrdR family protein